jgi:hypothetical protein
MSFKELNGSGIHRLENVLTLNLIARTYFDELQLWLEPVESVSNSPLPVSIGALTWVFRIVYPIPTKSVWLVLFYSTRVGSLL